MDASTERSAPALHTVTCGDGHRFELAVHAPPGATRGLVFVPALGVPARKYTAFAEALAARGVAVALHELRGGGTSNVRAARGSDWGYAELMSDLAATRHALASAHPSISWAVGGHSLGGQLAALEIALVPRAWSGLALVATGQPWWRMFERWKWPYVLGVFALFRLLTVVFGYFPGDLVRFGGREARRVMRDWSRSGFSGKYSIERMDVDCEAALARVETRIVAISMRRDPLAPKGAMDHLLGKMPRANVVRDTLDEHDHFTWMRKADPIADRIAALLERWSQPVDAT